MEGKRSIENRDTLKQQCIIINKSINISVITINVNLPNSQLKNRGYKIRFKKLAVMKVAEIAVLLLDEINVRPQGSIDSVL